MAKSISVDKFKQSLNMAARNHIPAAERRKGVFVVIEGADYAGKSHFAEMLVNSVSARLERLRWQQMAGHNNITLASGHYTREPYHKNIRECIKYDANMSAAAKGMMAIADRIDHSSMISDMVTRGGVMICDRYTPSTVVYNPLTSALGRLRQLALGNEAGNASVMAYVKPAIIECTNYERSLGIIAPDLYICLEGDWWSDAPRAGEESDTFDQEVRSNVRRYSDLYGNVVSSMASPLYSDANPVMPKYTHLSNTRSAPVNFDTVNGLADLIVAMLDIPRYVNTYHGYRSKVPGEAYWKD